MVVRRCFSLAILLPAAFLARFALADTQPDETLPGFKANDVYFSGTYDHVAAFSGDSNVAIPIGPAYPLGRDFTFQLKAFNSLKFWYLQDGTSCTMQSGDGDKDVTKAFVSGFPTIGAAWTVTPGYVMNDSSNSASPYTYLYVSPDGGHHPAYADGKTIDNSRLLINCTGGPPWTSCTVKFPDGTVQNFTQPLPDPAPSAGTSSDFILGDASQALGLTTVTDPYGRTMLTVQYGSPGWEVSRIYLGTTSSPSITYTWGTTTVGSVTWPVVNSIAFPAINGSLAQNVGFTYFATGFARTPADTTLGTAPCPCLTSEQDTATAYVPELEYIKYYNGPTTGTAIGTFTMGYDATNHQGALNSLTLPTGGVVSYQIGVDQHTAPDSTWPDLTLETNDRGLGAQTPEPLIPGCPPNHQYIAETLGNSAAVISRTVSDNEGNSSTTTFTRFDNVPTSYPSLNDELNGYDNRVVEVVEPKDGTSTPTLKMTRYMFHLDSSRDPSLSGVEIEHAVYDASTMTGTPVRTEIQCTDFSDSTGTCGYLTPDGTSVNSFSGADAHPSGHVLWYGAKPTNASDKSGGSCPSGTGTECISEKSTTPPNTWTSNGYHYEYTTTTSANMATNVNRGTDTVWAPQRRVLDLWSKRSVYDGTEPADGNQSDGSTVAREWAEFDSKGFYLGNLKWDSPAHQLLLTCRYPDGAGAAAHSFSFSDTEFTTPPSNSCRTYFPAWPPSPTALGTNGDYFGHDFSSQNAQLTFASWLTGASGSVQEMPWAAFNVSRDASTGKITSSTDSSAHRTTYVYDGLGRLTGLTPSGEEATAISYDTTTQTTVTRTGSGGNTWERYQYDGLGRLIREKKQLGGTNSFAVRAHAYDAAGHEYYTSEWKPCTSDSDCQSKTFTPATCPNGSSGAFGTTRCGYDPFDRPTKVFKADGSYSVTDRTDGSVLYSDTAETTTTYNSNGATAAGPYITKRDALGRVASVTEPSVGGGADTTTYTYNVLDKLSGVTQGVQARTFAYNGFGFLKSETNPENGTTSYTCQLAS